MFVTKNKSTYVKKVSGLWDFKTWSFKALVGEYEWDTAKMWRLNK